MSVMAFARVTGRHTMVSDEATSHDRGTRTMLADDAPAEAVTLSTATVAALLRATLVALQAEVAALTPAHLTWRPSPDAWCINEIIGHLIEAEQRGFAGRLRQILSQDDPRFEPWDQPAIAHARRDCERNGRELLHSFEQLRTASIHLVERIAPDQLARSGHHPVVGVIAVPDLLAEWVFHDRTHLQQILDNVKALAWPHMGNCRKFTDPAA